MGKEVMRLLKGYGWPLQREVANREKLVSKQIAAKHKKQDNTISDITG